MIIYLGAEKKQEAKDPLDSHKSEEESKQAPSQTPTQVPDEASQPVEETEEQKKKREEEEKRAKDIGKFCPLIF